MILSKAYTERSSLILLISNPSHFLIFFPAFDSFDVDRQLDLEISRRMLVSRGRGDDSGAVSWKKRFGKIPEDPQLEMSALYMKIDNIWI